MNADAPRIRRPGLLGLVAAASAAALVAACVSLLNLAVAMEASGAPQASDSSAAALKLPH